jgi:hypothetical protein
MDLRRPRKLSTQRRRPIGFKTLCRENGLGDNLCGCQSIKSLANANLYPSRRQKKNHGARHSARSCLAATKLQYQSQQANMNIIRYTCRTGSFTIMFDELIERAFINCILSHTSKQAFIVIICNHEVLHYMSEADREHEDSNEFRREFFHAHMPQSATSCG